MRRRTFLKKTAAASAAAIVSGPLFLNASDKSGSKRPVIGEEPYRYECYHEWGQLPNHLEWQTTHGVTIDEEGLVYITHQGHDNKTMAMDTVVVFDPQGKYVRSFGKEYWPGGHGIDVRKEGGEQFLYLSAMMPVREFAKTTLKGDVVWKKSFPKEAGVYKDVNGFAPTNVAFGPDGGFYVGDGYGSHYIHQYDKDAKWVRTWGGEGDAPGKMKTPHGLWLDDRPGRKPSLVVADRANARLQYFTLDGQHLSFVQGMLFPAHFDIRGDVLMVPDLFGRVTLLDRDNKPLAQLGEDSKRVMADKGFKIRSDPKLWQPGKFVHPHDACFDKDGNIFVIEWVQTGRVTFLRHLA